MKSFSNLEKFGETLQIQNIEENITKDEDKDFEDEKEFKVERGNYYMIYFKVEMHVSVLASVFKTGKPSGGLNEGISSAWYYIMSAEVLLALLGDSDVENKIKMEDIL